MRFLDDDAFLLSFSNTASTSTAHAGKEFVLTMCEIDFEAVIHAVFNAEPIEISECQTPVHHLKVHAAQFIKRILNQRLDHLPPVHIRGECTPHVRGAPTWERTSQDPQAELSYNHADEVAKRLLSLL